VPLGANADGASGSSENRTVNVHASTPVSNCASFWTVATLVVTRHPKFETVPLAMACTSAVTSTENSAPSANTPSTTVAVAPVTPGWLFHVIVDACHFAAAAWNVRVCASVAPCAWPVRVADAMVRPFILAGIGSHT
jgi:hypothetical protein